MKIQNRYGYTWIMAVCLLLSGCDSFLSHEPDDRLEVNTLDRIAQTITGAYNTYSTRFTDMSTDNVGKVEGVSYIEIILEDLYTWNRDFRNQEHQDSPGAYWVFAYRGISNVNLALTELENLEIAEADRERAAAIRGEALVLRSYYHFMLVNLFAPHYDETTAGTTLGVPYVKTVEDKLVVDYPRETVEKVYELAEEDLTEGIRQLEIGKSHFMLNKYHFTFPTVYLYASRFYLFRNRDEEDVEAAVGYAEKSIDAFGGVGVMRDWMEYATDNYGPIDIEQSEVGMVQECPTWTAAYQWGYSLNEIIKNRYFRNPFRFTDYRLEIGYQTSGNIFMPAFYFVVNPNGTSTAVDIFPFSEALFNAAEAHARNKDYDRSLQLMKEFGKHVYANYDASAVTLEALTKYYGYFEGDAKKLALIDYILYERRVHFLYKGMRWFDIRRYDLEVEHTLQNGEVIYLSEEAPGKDYQIPRFAIDAGMTPNEE